MTEEELKTPNKENNRVPKMSVGALVRIEVEVSADGAWGPECQVDQVLRQGGEEALHKVERAMRGIGGRVIGHPRVQMIWAEERK